MQSGPHDVEDLGHADAVLASRCHTCGSAATVEFPTADQHATIRYWLVRHPPAVRRSRPGLILPAVDPGGRQRD